MPYLPAVFRCRAASLGVFCALAFGAPVAAVPPVTTPQAIVGAPFEYKGAVQGSDGSVIGMETAIRRFDPVNGTGPTVYLVSAIHIGEKSYYRRLQEFLKKQDVVLYEGVRPLIASKRTPPKPKSVQQGNEFHVRLAKALNLSMQGEIDYRQPNFQHSDLSWQEMERLAIQDGPATRQMIRKKLSQHSLSGTEGKELTNALKMLTSDPALARSFRKNLVEKLLSSDPRAPKEKSKTELQEEKAEARLDAIFITARNKTVIADLKRLLTRPKKPLRSIALFYGAGHMQDLDARLESELGYRGRGADWLTAITVAP